MNLDLKNQKCKPCSGNTPKFKPVEISMYLSKLDDWSINDEQDMIFKKYKFKTFKKALNFTNLVSDIAESEGHHPDISLGWGYCLVMIHTHAIKGLSINDFILGSKIDLISIK